MTVAGIICEYNPFHEGHRYHIQKVREITGADVVVAVMNGNFVQRGEPAVTDKYTRTKMALSEGADMVFELPVCYGLSSAESFAYGGIHLLDSLGFVDNYCFGSEAVDSQLLQTAGQFFAQESKEYQNELTRLLKSGMSFPAARERAYCNVTGCVDEESKKLFLPNNTLGIEYIKSAQRIHSRMKPVVIERSGLGYNDQMDEMGESNGFLSATAIRTNMKSKDYQGIPKQAKTYFLESPCFMDVEDFWDVCSYAIRSKWNELERYKDVSEELANVFRENWYLAISFEDFVNRCKTKNITMARIKRCIFQILLEITKEQEDVDMPYVRILGMKRETSNCLKEIQKTSLVGRLATDSDKLGDSAKCRLSQDIFASDIYRSAMMKKSGVYIPDEYKQKLIIQ